MGACFRRKWVSCSHGHDGNVPPLRRNARPGARLVESGAQPSPDGARVLTLNVSRYHWSITLLCALSHCARTQEIPTRGRLEVRAEGANDTAFTTPARWDYHPRIPASALAALAVEGGGCTFTAAGGQRWYAPTTRASLHGPVCSGKPRTTGFVAREDLVGVIHRSNGIWVYVGESGTLFESHEMLGAFSRTTLPPEPFTKVGGATSAILGATLSGQLFRWDDALGWRRLPAPRESADFPRFCGWGGRQATGTVLSRGSLHKRRRWHVLGSKRGGSDRHTNPG